jgi:hypothetical protein
LRRDAAHCVRPQRGNSFTPQCGTSASPPADVADKKIETFGFASLDVPRGRVMLWGKTGSLSGFCASRFTAHKKAIGVVPAKELEKSQALEGDETDEDTRRCRVRSQKAA